MSKKTFSVKQISDQLGDANTPVGTVVQIVDENGNSKGSAVLVGVQECPVDAVLLRQFLQRINQPKE